MLLREAIRQIDAFRYLTEQLDLCSSPGRAWLMELPWRNTRAELGKEYDALEEALRLKRTDADGVNRVREKLREVLNIRGTVKRLQEGRIADDPELFELKKFALTVATLREWTRHWAVTVVPDLEPVVDLLDPEKTRVPHFYVYDAYSPELAALRKQLRQLKEQGEPEAVTAPLYFRAVALEDDIRAELCGRLTAYAALLQQAIDEVCRLDILLAKALQIEKLGLVRPSLTEDAEGITFFRGLFNPRLRDLLQARKKEFQPVEIELTAEATVITGANMAGKTVLLKTLALAQTMAQFGFFVPAAEAAIVLVEDVALCIGDEQDETTGLSSFAAEMCRIGGIWKNIRAGKRLLVLIDEPARTTNPSEGRAFVNAMVEFLTARKCRAVLTTHYGDIIAPCRKWRVRGFREDRTAAVGSVADLNDYIDYRLQRDDSGEVPREAIRIARMLGIDEGLLEAAGRFMTGGKQS